MSSHWPGGGDYHRDRRGGSPPRFPDRRPSYNEPSRAPKLRDAPPLGRPSFRDSRDYTPRDIEPGRPRRNSRDGPLPAGSSYPDTFSSYRGGFGRGRGRGDPDFRGGRGARRFGDRDLHLRDRSPPGLPPRWDRERERTPPRRDERRYDRRDDGRWNDSWSDRDRETDRWRDAPPSLEGRQTNDSQFGPPTQSAVAGHVNPDRLALIEDSNTDASVRRGPVVPGPPHTARADVRREQPDVPAYLSGRADITGNKYPSRASSPPAQPPPVPAFTLSFAPPTQSAAPKPEVKADIQAVAPDNGADRTEMSPALTPAQRSPVIPKAPRTLAQAASPSFADAPPSAPRAQRVLEDQAGGNPNRLQNARSWENLSSAPSTLQPRASGNTQPTSPVMMTGNRLLDINPPTGPKAARTASQASQSPRPSVSDSSYNSNALPRPRTPPITAPSGPRAHAISRSPEMAFIAPPTGPKGDRAPPVAPRAQERANTLLRGNDRVAPQGQPRMPPTAPRSGWNLWRRDTAPPLSDKRDSTANERRQEHRDVDQHVHGAARDAPRPQGSGHVDPAEVKRPASPPKGHSAQRSFFGQPAATDQYDDMASDVADDSISSTDEDEIEVEDLALFEAKFKRRQRELEAKLIDLSAREYRATTPLETIARLARVTMQDLERFRERDTEMDIDDSQLLHSRGGVPTTQSPGSEEGADVPTPKGGENTSVLIHTEEEAEEDVRRVFHPVPELISLPYMTRDGRHGSQYDLDTDMHESIEKGVQHEFQSDFAERDRSWWNLEQEFGERYQQWREICEELDEQRQRQEELERQMSLEPGPEPDVIPNMASNPVFEGRRLHKFASEYEIEQVLKQSEETARIEQEKADREAKRVQADMEKEAELPDQLQKDAYLAQAFVDENRLRDPGSLTVVFTYEPAPDNFTDEEQQIFVAAFKETPKKWTEIASLLPDREPKDCIRHYYANKWDGRFRDNKHRRNKAGRRGRGGKTVRSRGSAAMADLAGGDEMPVAVSDSGRPKRAAAPTTFAEKESEAKAMLTGQSPGKRANVKQEGTAESEKPVKRRKGAAEKPGRKPKGTQPLAQIAAAPILSPEGRPMQSKESTDRSRALEDASLLASLHAGRPPVSLEQQTMFATSDKYMPRSHEDAERLRVPMQAASSKPSPSSYWSVPEQGDFMKYIAYFGTDFAAIAAHMGTKTQTMIKNHYQRQIDGSHPGLEESALAANARRQRGENLGAPPTPTPITKRKYDSAATITQKPTVSQGDPMDVDEFNSGVRPPLNKHGSPHQFSIRPQYPPTTAPTPQVSHAGPMLAAQESSATPLLAAARPYQSGHGGRPGMFSDTRTESRSSVSGAPSFFPPVSAAASQAPLSSRTAQDSHDPYIRGLLEEQQRAMRIQDQQYQEDQVDPYYQRAPHQHQQQQSHRSPMLSHPHTQHERRALNDLKERTPPYFSARSTPADPSRKMNDRSVHQLDPVRFPPPNSQAIASPPKREPSRAAPAAPGHGSSSSRLSGPAAEVPKRMDLFSMLNNSEESKPKRSSLDMAPASSAVPRAGSPAQHGGLAASPYSALAKHRSDSYSQPVVGQFSAPRSSMSHMPAPARSPAPPTPLKQEALPSGMAPAQDWPTRSNVHGMPSSQAPPPLERDVRPYYSHRLLSQGEPSRANPSPPPLSGMQHSRGSSIVEGPPRGFGGPAANTPASSLGSSLFKNMPAYSHASSLPATAAHSHHPNYASLHQRGPSREDSYNRDQAIREDRREREEREWRYQRDRDEAERQRMEAERRHEHDRHYSRGSTQSLQPPHPPHPPHPPPPPYSMPYESNSSRMLSLREQSAREAEIAMQQQEERMRHGNIYGREREQQPQPQASDDGRRRHDDAFLARRTPLGGGYGGPPNLPTPGRR